ncbi:MAG: histidinol-phosphate transaminase [Sphingobium sp.]
MAHALDRRGFFAAGALLPLMTDALPAATAGQAPPLRLSLNENPFGPSPAVRRALAAEAARLSRYADPDAADRLTRIVAEREGVPPGQIILGDILERLGIHLAAQAPAGGRFILSTPGYTALTDAAATLGGQTVGVPLDRNLANDLPALTEAVKGSARALFLVNPHNPTGIVGASAQWDSFLTDAAARTLVIVDEAYLDYDDLPRLTAARLTRAGHNVAVFRTFDKIHGLAALPFGYLVAPAPLAGSLRQSGVGAAHGLSRLALAGAEAALADTAWTQEVRRRTLAGRDRLSRALSRLGLEQTPSHANFLFFRSPAADALRAGLARSGILVGRTFPPLGDWIRITVGTEDEVTRTIHALEQLAGASA